LTVDGLLGWIAAARVEELANKPIQARNLILSACEACHDCEDVWIEASRLHRSVSLHTSRVILANAVSALPQSVKLWLAAAELEADAGTVARKKAVLRRALEYIPHSVQLWESAIELETANDAKLLLYRAVECVPQCVDMWLALAKLETHDNARKVGCLSVVSAGLSLLVKIW
jgi:pre-mRNA-processing factor 6